MRKATLTQAEDIPVAAGDTVIVGPGAYRETLTVDVSGGSATYITYVGDVSGASTDGIGGTVRLTGANATDTGASLSNVVLATGKNFREFRGFVFDGTTSTLMSLNTSGCGWKISDCVFQSVGVNNLTMSGSHWSPLVERCIFYASGNNYGITFTHSATINNCGANVRNSVFIGGYRGINIDRVGGVNVQNCTFWGRQGLGIEVATALTAGQTETVGSCIFNSCGTALKATTAGEITENYCNFWGCGTNRTNTASGANDTAYPTLEQSPILLDGFLYQAPVVAQLSAWSGLRMVAGSGIQTDDLTGVTRPVTSGKQSCGAVQFVDVARSTTQTYDSSSAALKLADAGRAQLFMPTAAEATTVDVYAYREAGYTGTAPQLVVKQPGVADITATDTGASGAWNLITSGSFTPAAVPPWVTIELVSNNTGSSTGVYFDGLAAS